MSKTQLNQDQQKIADEIFTFLLNPNQREYIISGGGGVGKTFLVKYLINSVIPKYINTLNLLKLNNFPKKYFLTATTSKAAKVLQENTGETCKTIHSLLGLTPKINYSTGKTYLAQNTRYIKYKNILAIPYIYIIDECSMIDNELYTWINESIKEGSKIIYVGDSYQLPPINCKISPIYVGAISSGELTKPFRNANQSDLVKLSSQLRNTVKTLKFNDIQCVPGVIDHMTHEEFEDQFNSLFLNSRKDIKILAYTNASVLKYTDKIVKLRNLDSPCSINNYYVISNTTAFTKDVPVDSEIYVTFISNYIHKQKSFNPSLRDIPYKGILFNYDGVELSGFICLDNNLLNEHLALYKKEKNWDNYYALKEAFVDLRLADVQTIHKSQGSTYNTVYIDLTDLGTCFDPNIVARLLYVAVTRATTRVVFIGELPEKYGRIKKD